MKTWMLACVALSGGAAMGQSFVVSASAPAFVLPGQQFSVEVWGSVSGVSWTQGVSAMAAFQVDLLGSGPIAQASNILVLRCQDTDFRGFGIKAILRIIPECRIRQVLTVFELSQQFGLDRQRLSNTIHNGLTVKVGIGDGNEQIQRNQVICLA